MKYGAFVVLTAVLLKMPRFFHFKLTSYDEAPGYWMDPILEDPEYIIFSSYWDDLFTTGFLPLAIVTVFNIKIYLKVCRDQTKHLKHLLYVINC